MKQIVKILGLVCFVFTGSLAQQTVNSELDLEVLKKLPQEKVYVSHTGPVVFSGEYLYFSFQCFSAQNSRLSSQSKLGYLALVNGNKEYLFEQKIRLNDGLGQGDFFVSTEIPSGVYKLLGYTQWMKNNGLAQVFKDDLIIINPYAADQSLLLSKTQDKIGDKEKGTPSSLKMDSSVVGIILKKFNYQKREKVELGLKNYKGNLGYGTYSIRVQKKDGLYPNKNSNAISFANDYLNVDKLANLDRSGHIFLPERDGELLIGTVKDKITGKPISETPVVVSLPGKQFVLKSVLTDFNGGFYTYLREDYQTGSIVLQATGTEKEANIQLKPSRKLNLDNLEFGEYTIQKEMSEAIKLRSIHNQVENQYFAMKPDSILQTNPENPFNSENSMVFNLDDYTRFKTFKETLVEIINIARYRPNPTGNDFIRIVQDFKRFNEELNNFPAIVLFDGVFVSDHNSVKDYNAKNIKSISLIRDQFRLGNEEYQGIMYVETFDGDYFKDYRPPNGVLLDLKKPIPQKNYFSQVYDQTGSFDRIPDYRRLLLWKPNVVVDEGQLQFEFFTSDITGEFEIIVDGFTTYGKPISFSRSITVE
ncbi:hypothetical protein [Croceivirga thetidis]|uniref:Macroglobulin domain-containing protein n=1 Tax=Croceivirga thetidis TaxID=2721623 RepID=A0ABX1GRA6_9FLAO|nr:hypothetical protein [Croceivirga thetidis]NKI32468.1 hypothetical protein [Croceivirga thetidis]